VAWGGRRMAGRAGSLSRQGLHCWLRLQRPLGGGRHGPPAWPRTLWEEAVPGAPPDPARPEPRWESAAPTSPQRSAGRRATAPGGSARLALVESGELRKLVVAVRQPACNSIRPLDRWCCSSSCGGTSRVSCRFPLHAAPGDALIGASRATGWRYVRGQLAQATPWPAPLPGARLADQLSRSG